jgi:hypothetical protein
VAVASFGPARRIGFAGSFVQLGLAVFLGVLASGPGTFPDPPEPVPRGLAMVGLYALPAVIGAIGAMRGRRSLLAAAAVMSTVGSVLAFSGVTLLFLIPAFVFAAAAATSSAPQVRAGPPPLLVVVVALAIVAMLVTLVLALRLGILVLPALMLLVIGLAVARGTERTRTRAADAARGLAMGAAVVALGIGAGWTLLSMTETRCWRAFETPSGIESEIRPGADEGLVTSEPGMVAGGCNSGVLTVRGAAVAAALGISSVALAAASVRDARAGPA